MRRLKHLFGVILVLIATVLTVDWIRVRARDGRVARSVSHLGGRMGSIPFWPIGTEYRITFRRVLTSDELEQLAELNSLRGSVGVAFVDCDLSPLQVLEARKKLWNCRLYRVTGGEMSGLEDD